MAVSKNNPILTVVIPVFNVAQYLEQCLGSVLSQGFAPGELEVIVVDDGSTDGSDLIAEKWAGKNPDVQVHRRENGGLSAARNSGLDRARGQFLTFLDSDDIVPPHAYRGMLKTLQSSGSDFVTAAPFRFSWWNRHARPFTRNQDLFTQSEQGLTLATRPEFIRDFTAWNKIYRRQFFLETGVRFPDGRIYEDVATSPLLYHQATAFDVYNKPGLFWRVTPGGITQTIKPVKAVDRLWALDTVHRFLLDNAVSNPVLEEFGFAVLDYNLRWVFLEYRRFDVATREFILDEAERLLSSVPDSVINRVQHPLNEWGLLAKHGQKQQLAALLENPSLSLPDLPIQEATSPDAPQNPYISPLPSPKRSFPERFNLGDTALTQKRRIKNLFLYSVLRPALGLLPLLPRTAVFSSYWGKKFSRSDAPAALCLELNKSDPRFHSVVFADMANLTAIQESVQELAEHPDRITVVANNSFLFFYYIWRAKYLFNDVNFQLAYRVDKGTRKRRGQIEVQTTHGIPIKKMGLDSEEAIHPDQRSLFLNRSKRYDYLVSTSTSVATVFGRSHGITPKILESGLPQHDILFTPPSPAEVSAIKERYGLDPHKKLVLYAPTFRNAENSAFPYLMDLNAMHERLGENYQIVLKPHPFNHTRLESIDFRDLTDYAQFPAESPFIKLMGKIRVDADYSPVTMNPDRARSTTRYSHIDAPVNDLLFAADVLITDYSSVVFGYTHTKKPLVLFTPDKQHYDSSRGTYFDIDAVAPGPVAKTTSELIEAILLAEDPARWSQQFEDTRRTFTEEFLLWDKGDAAARVLRGIGILNQL